MTTISDDLMRSWRLRLQAKGSSPRTITAYSYGLKGLQAWLTAEERSLDVSTIDRYTMEAHQLWLSQHYKTSTVAVRHNALKQLFAFLVDEDEIRTNPMDRVPLPQVKDQPVPVFEDDTISAMLALHAGKTFKDRRNTAILSLLADSGARREEIATLRLTDVDVLAGTASVMGKGGSRRTVTFGTQTAVALDRYLRARKSHPYAERSERLWLGLRGPFGNDGVGGLVRTTCERLGIQGHTHIFRHTWASAMKEAGAQPDEIKALAGWRSDRMLAKYGRATLERRAVSTGRRHSTMDRLKRQA
jgi:site-specific recombinase XerD